MSNSVQVFIDRKIVVLHEDDRVYQAARAMCESQVGCVIVADREGHITGILTDRDIVCNSVASGYSDQTRLREIMETDLVTLHAHSTIDDAVAIMKANGIRRLPIVETTRGSHQRCTGMVTLDDLIAGEFVTLHEVSTIVKSQILRRKNLLPRDQATTARSEQTYRTFIAEVSARANLDSGQCEEIIRFVLSAIVQRLHYTGGAHLIAQLPKRLQEYLMNLKAGPDRNIDAGYLIQGLALRTGKNVYDAKYLLAHIWEGIRKHISPGEADHVLDQLPTPFREALSPQPRFEDDALSTHP